MTDGERVYALFGSAGLYCLDVGGNPVWDVDLGDMHSKHGHGEGASPALHGDTLVVNWDHEGDSFVVALDKLTGEQRWKVERDEVTSWSTPIVVEHDGKAQVIISASNRIRGYDLKTGEVIWECGGLSHNVVASPVAGGGLVYAGSNYDTRALLAIRLDGARGDITGTDRVAWTRTRDTPYVPSPLLYGERLYFLKVFHGILTCVDAVTGDPVFGPIRLPGVSEVYASPVGAAGRVYITSIAGTTLVINHDGPPEMMAANQLDDRFNASPALADGELYLRGEEYLYCIAEDASARPEERVFEESDGRVTVEAEHFLEQTETGTRAWHLTTTTVTPSFDDDADGPHTEGAGGGAYLEILPDTRQNHSHELIPGENFSNTPGQLAILHYKVRFQQAGRYYVWVRAFSTGSEDNGLHVGIDGEWPDSGQRLQWCDGKHAWRWESKQRTAANHCGEPHKIYVDVTEPGVHTIQFSMREDGFEFDQFILTTNRDFVPPP